MNRDELRLRMGGVIPFKGNYGQSLIDAVEEGVTWDNLSIIGNSIPCEPEIAVIVTSWLGHLKYLKATLSSYRKAGYFVILSYDNPFYAWDQVSSEYMIGMMPNQMHLTIANAFVMKHITYDADKRNGWLWNTQYAQAIVKNFPNIKYVYVTNGDCICEKAEGFKDVIALLGDNEMTAGQSMDHLIHTATMFFKVEAFHKLFNYMYKRIEKPVIGSHSPEELVREAVDNLGIKFIHMPKQPMDTDGTLDAYSRFDQDSTWKELLGYKNLFELQELAGESAKEPLPAKYFDFYKDCIYFNSEEKSTLCQYYLTGDRRYLYKFWDIWEDSDYNRLYYPLEHYGKEPIYADQLATVPL